LTKAQGQSSWNQDESWAEQGWWLEGEGFWQQPIWIAPWENALAIASEAFDADGDVQPQVWRVEEDGTTSLLPMPVFDSLEIRLKHIRSGADGTLWALANGIGVSTEENSGLSSDWIQIKWSDGESTMPEISFLSFGSPFQSVLGWAPSDADGTNGGLALGYVLDPCCFHKEMPALVRMDENGLGWTGFGTNGSLIVDLGNSSVTDTLGVATGFNRHEIGGYYTCAAEGQNGNWYAAGAYSNAYHYELLLAKHLANGQLDTTFGTNGWAHLNISPGQNHSAKAIALEGESIVVLLENEITDDLPAGWNQVKFDLNGSALAMQTIEFGENWSSNGFVALPNAQLLGIGSDPSEGTQSTHLVQVFSEELHATPLLPNNPLSGQWHNVLGTYHPEWGQLITVGQWDQGTSGRVLLGSRWSTGAAELLFPPTSKQEIASLPFPNPANSGSLVTIPCTREEALQSGWGLMDQSGKSIAIEWLRFSRQIQLPITLSPGYYFIDHPLHTHRWPLKVQ
jgi:hypothetical protein